MIFQIIQQTITRTRSQTKLNPDKFTRIPLLAKILKLLISEMSSVDTLEYSDDEDVSLQFDDKFLLFLTFFSLYRKTMIQTLTAKLRKTGLKGKKSHKEFCYPTC